MREDRIKDAVSHRPAHLRLTAPSPWVVRFAPLVPAAAAVLDLACGGGRHTRFFLARGHPVTAIDRDLEWLDPPDGTPGLTRIEADLESDAPWPVGEARFGAVVVTNYLYRPLFPRLIGALAPEGVLIYETFATGNERFGRPRNPDHLLRPGELIEAVRERLRVVAYEETEVSAPKPARIQRICAVSPDRQR
ncbi:MAG: class I SAM-dependent methyltransferase [Alphaproteobacteria bacterium]